LLDEAGGGQIENDRPVHLLVEVEIEILQGAIGITEGGELVPARQESVFAPAELMGDEVAIRSSGASRSAWAWRNRVSRTLAMPDSRSCRSARSSSTSVIQGLLFSGR
jgi:hypothetical protein